MIFDFIKNKNIIIKNKNIKVYLLFNENKYVLTGKVSIIKKKFFIIDKYYKSNKIAEIKIHKSNPNIIDITP
ncbi:hypothetical protein ACT2CC_00350 [Candidatus Vidania fulgoroideorum]